MVWSIGVPVASRAGGVAAGPVPRRGKAGAGEASGGIQPDMHEEHGGSAARKGREVLGRMAQVGIKICPDPGMHSVIRYPIE